MTSQPMTLDDLVCGLESDPARVAEARRHYEAILAALNKSQTDGEQDALTVFEAVGAIIGQLTATMGEREAEGLLVYIAARARHYRPQFAAAGTGARHYTECLN